MNFPEHVRIEDVWDQIKPYVEDMIRDSHGDYRPEDVYAMCKLGDAKVLLSEDGFCIYRIIHDPISGDKVFWSWQAAGFRHCDLVRTYTPFLERIARQNGCKSIAFNAHRPGYLKTLKGEYEAGLICFRRRLT